MRLAHSGRGVRQLWIGSKSNLRESGSTLVTEKCSILTLNLGMSHQFNSLRFCEFKNGLKPGDRQMAGKCEEILGQRMPLRKGLVHPTTVRPVESALLRWPKGKAPSNLHTRGNHPTEQH